jgi:H+/Cl- antiporter ClcA
LAATGFAKGFAVAFGAVLAAAGFKAEVLGAAFEAVAFEPAAFVEVFAVLLGIALLLFFEDLPAEAFATLLREVLARLLVAPRLAADAFFELLFVLLETLFLRVF